MNFGLLAYFKYRNFFVDTVGMALGTEWQLPPLVLPLAISFFTFEQITYLVDAYHADTGEYDFLSYCLFISFFPHLIAGPIVRFKQLVPQFAAGIPSSSPRAIWPPGCSSSPSACSRR